MRRLIFLLPLFTVSYAIAQSNYAAVNGIITDPEHRPVVGASVDLTSASTHAIRHVSSNDQGMFLLTGILPDEYTLNVQASGFAVLQQTLHVEVGQQVSLTLPLSVASVKSSVNVGSNADILQTTNASVGEVVEPKSVEDLPLNGRMLLDLVLTVPGTHVGFGAQQGNVNPLYWRPGQSSALVIGGARANANFYLLDGATNTDPTFNTQNLSPSPDSVREFRVDTSSYTADMGGAGGGQVNIVTHSGTNRLHGTAYEFARNDAMDASSFGSMGNNHLVRNNFGAALGGPLKLPVLNAQNTFFFLNYEGLRLTQADTQILTVPTMDEINGDFSNSGINIYDPGTAHANPTYNPALPVSPTNAPTIRNQFVSNGQANVIPQNKINPIAQQFLMAYVPAPNMSMNMMGPDSNNYLDVRDETHTENQGTARIDHNFSAGDSVFGRYSLSSEHGFTPSSGTTATTENLPGFGANFDNLSQQGVLSWNHIFSLSKFNSSSVAVSRLAMSRDSQNDGVRDISAQLGIKGIGYGGFAAAGAPWFAVQGYTGMGDTFAATPMHAWDTMLEARDTYAWQKGRHGMKFGGSYRRFIWPMWGFFQNRGYYQFTNGYTTQTQQNDGTGSALASFLLGLPAVRQVQAGIPQMQLRNWGTDAFAEDSWQITPTLTVNAGLRYEYESPLQDIRKANSNMIFQNGVPSIFIGGQQGYPRGLMYSNKRDFAPRIGMAKNFTDLGLVFHASYGIFYTPVDLNTWCNQRHNVPDVFPETFQFNNFVPPPGDGFDFSAPVLGQTPVSFTTFDPHAAAQYVQQWNAHAGKSIGEDMTVEIGYLGARGFHLQQAVLINNASPGPGAIGPRRPIQSVSFVPGTVLPPGTNAVSMTLTAPAILLLQNTAKSWYDAGYINLRRRYSHGLSVLANYTFSKSLTNAPDFRSPMDESAIPQNDTNLAAEKGPGCDVRNRFAFSGVYDIPSYQRNALLSHVTGNWQLATVYQAQSGMPFTVSVFGDTANSGNILGENPIRANYNGKLAFGPGTRTAVKWFNTSAFSTPAAFTFGNVGRNSLYGPGMQTLDLAISRSFHVREGIRLLIRAEAYNALNKVNLSNPNRFANTPQFGSITMPMTPGRQIQLNARVSF